MEFPAFRFPQLDLADFDSVRAFAKAWGDRSLHVLINNAGIMALPKHTLESSGEERQMQVNHHGHFLLTGLLLPSLKASAPSRVVAVSSLISETAHNQNERRCYELQRDVVVAWALSTGTAECSQQLPKRTSPSFLYHSLSQQCQAIDGSHGGIARCRPHRRPR